jgi:outer membrane receptor protein involved in Fe transport
MVQWSRAFQGNQVFSAGVDWRWVEGESQETAYNTAINVLTPTTQRLSGGSQTMEGVFAQDIITPSPKWQLTLSARMDHWRSYNAHNLETTIATGAPTPTTGRRAPRAKPRAWPTAPIRWSVRAPRRFTTSRMQ